MKKKKYDPLKDIVEGMKINVASGVGVIAMGSLPSTPQAPALEGAKSFAGASFGMISTIHSAKSVFSSLESLEMPKKKRRK